MQRVKNTYVLLDILELEILICLMFITSGKINEILDIISNLINEEGLKTKLCNDLLNLLKDRDSLSEEDILNNVDLNYRGKVDDLLKKFNGYHEKNVDLTEILQKLVLSRQKVILDSEMKLMNFSSNPSGIKNIAEERRRIANSIYNKNKTEE